ncbi:hypothetical protein FKM82_027981 [Ascaphus truei]
MVLPLSVLWCGLHGANANGMLARNCLFKRGMCRGVCAYTPISPSCSEEPARLGSAMCSTLLAFSDASKVFLPGHWASGLPFRMVLSGRPSGGEKLRTPPD